MFNFINLKSIFEFLLNIDTFSLLNSYQNDVPNNQNKLSFEYIGTLAVLLKL